VIAVVIAIVNYVEDTPTSQAFFTLRLCKFCLSTPLKIVELSNSLVFDALNVCFLALNSCFQGVPIIMRYASNHHSTTSLYTFSTIIVIFLISYHSLSLSHSTMMKSYDSKIACKTNGKCILLCKSLLSYNNNS
jgi:hypothetical protein